MKTAAIIEARMGSTRLPGKHMKLILGKPVIELLAERLKQVKLLDKIVLACTTNKNDNILENQAKRLKIKCFRGSEDDVLGRVLKATKSVKADVIVETLGDCPLTDPKIITQCINAFLSGKYDYISNALKPTFPNGLDVQIYSTKLLAKVALLTNNPFDREHVTYYIYQHPEKYKILNIEASGELYWPELAITLDTIEDYRLIKKIFERLYPTNPQFTALDIVRFLRQNPKLMRINRHIIKRKS